MSGENELVSHTKSKLIHSKVLETMYKKLNDASKQVSDYLKNIDFLFLQHSKDKVQHFKANFIMARHSILKPINLIFGWHP